MRRILSILFCFCLLVGCQYKSNVLTIGEITRIYYDTLQTKFPNDKFVIIDDSTIETSVKNHDLLLTTDNFYKQYRLQPDSLKSILEMHISALLEIIRDSHNVDDIIPIIKPIGYLDEIVKRNDTVDFRIGQNIVYDNYNDDLVVIYAFDKENTIKYMIESDMNTLSIDKDSIRNIALKNLYRILTTVSDSIKNNVHMLIGDNTHEHSLILLDELFSDKYLSVDGEYVVSIPNRGIIMITGSNDKIGIPYLKKLSSQKFKKNDHPISPLLFIRKSGKFEKYKE